MRKIILIFLMLIIAVVLGYTVYEGFQLGNFEVFGYGSIDKKSKELENAIIEYDDKNLKEISYKQKDLETKITEYNEQKESYEQILSEKQTDLLQIDTANCYDVDFLWTRVGNYATSRGLDLEMNIAQSMSDQGKNEYILADLSFSAIGDYNLIADFIDDLEKDERLEFEIRDFNMKREKIKVNEIEKIVLKATFTVYGVAINKSTLTNLTTNTNQEMNSVENTTGANF